MLSKVFPLVVLLFCVQVSADETATTDTSASEKRIAKALESLDHSDFVVREQASNDLLAIGDAAKPALQSVVKNGSIESSRRASRILEDIELGISAETSDAKASLLRKFGASNQAERATLLSNMLLQGDFEPIPKLIDRIDDRRIKHALFQQSFANTAVMIKLVESQRFDWWVQKANEANLAVNRRDLIIAWLSRGDALRELEDKDELSIVEEVFAQEPHDESRFVLASRLIDQHVFMQRFQNESNIELLLRLFDLKNNPAARQELVIRFVRKANQPTIFQPAVLEKLLQFSNEQGALESKVAVKQALWDSLLTIPNASQNLKVENFVELSSDFSETGLQQSVQKAFQQTSFKNWAFDPDNFRPLLDWAATLPESSRSEFIVTLSQGLAYNWRSTTTAIANPSTLDFYWQLADSIKDEKTKERVKLRLAPTLVLDAHFNTIQREQAVALVVSSASPEADIALDHMLQQDSFRERIYDDHGVKDVLIRCGKMKVEANSTVLQNAFSSVFAANALRDYFKETANSDWLVNVYLPSLTPAVRDAATKAICQSVRLMQVWEKTTYPNTLLEHAKKIIAPADRLSCIASMLRMDPLINLTDDDERLPLLKLYRDDSLPDEARAKYMLIMSGNQAYLDWLGKTGQATEFIDIIEHFVSQPNSQVEGIYRSPIFFSFLASQNRLNQWFAFYKKDPARSHEGLSMFVYRADTLSVELLEENLEALVQLTDSVVDPRQRGEYTATLLLSPAALELHKRQNKLADLLQRLNSHKEPSAREAIYRSLSRIDVMRFLIEADQAISIVDLGGQRPAGETSILSSLVLHPMVVESIVDKKQTDRWFDVVLANGVERSHLFRRDDVLSILVNRGYLNRLLQIAETAESRAVLTTKVLSAPGAIELYAKEGKTVELVNLFKQLEPGMPRDAALRALFLRSEVTRAICQELGPEESYALVNTIQYPFYLTNTRMNVIIACCELGKVRDEWLSQLLEDMGNTRFMSETRRRELLSDAVGGQILAAGLFPKLKENIEKTNERVQPHENPAMDDFYSSPFVLEHLRSIGKMDEFVSYAKSITDPNRAGMFIDRLLKTPRGREVMLSSNGVPTLIAIAETMSDYFQSHFWERFCANDNVLDFVLESDECGDLLQFLAERKQTEHEWERLVVKLAQHKRLERLAKNQTLLKHLVESLSKTTAATQTSVALHVSRNATLTWAMVEADQWDALCALVQCESLADAKASRWKEFVWRSGGVIQALIANNRSEQAMELLRNVENSSDGLTNDLLWLRLAEGNLQEHILALEAKAESLRLSQWKWLALAYRAQGEDGKAMAAATKAVDRGLLTALAIERSDWNTAASILQDAPAPYLGVSPSNEEELALEHQAMLLVARLYAGQSDQLQPSIDKLVELRAKSTNLRIQSRCCDALLLGEQFEPAFNFIDQQIPHRALRLRLHQREYGLAIEASKWSANDPQAFLTAVRKSTGSDFGMMQSAAELLKAMSYEEKHHDMRILHEAMMSSLLKKPSGIQRSQSLGLYAAQLYRYELFDLFWPTLRQVDAAGTLLFNNLFMANSTDEVSRIAAWYLPQLVMGRPIDFGGTRDVPSVIEALRVTENILRTGQQSTEQLNRWIENARGPNRNVHLQPEMAFTVGVLCLKQDRWEDAKSILEPLIDSYPLSALVLARDAWKRKEWLEAATFFDRFHARSCDRIEALYLSGLALVRAGQTKAGTEEMKLALKVNYQPVSQLRLAFELKRVGELELANDLTRKVLRLASHHSYSHLEAIMHLIENSTSPQEIAGSCQQWQFVQSRYRYGNGEQADFLRVPLLLHSALAEGALSNHDWDRLSEELSICKKIATQDKEFAEQWSERLTDAGQTDLLETWHKQ